MYFNSVHLHDALHDSFHDVLHDALHVLHDVLHNALIVLHDRFKDITCSFNKDIVKNFIMYIIKDIKDFNIFLIIRIIIMETIMA